MTETFQVLWIIEAQQNWSSICLIKQSHSMHISSDVRNYNLQMLLI